MKTNESVTFMNNDKNFAFFYIVAMYTFILTVKAYSHMKKMLMCRSKTNGNAISDCVTVRLQNIKLAICSEGCL